MKLKFRKRFWSVLSGLLLATALGGCVVYPSGYAYNGYGYAPVYAPVYVAPPVFGGVFIGGGYGYGGGRRWR